MSARAKRVAPEIAGVLHDQNVSLSTIPTIPDIYPEDDLAYYWERTRTWR